MSNTDFRKAVPGTNPALDCPNCKVLRDAFVEAVHEVVMLNERHLLAVIEDDPDPHRFDLLIHQANEKKQNAKYAFVHHRESHGLSSERG